MSDLFKEYVGRRERDGVVAAAVVEEGRIRELSQITGGTAVSKTVRGGSVVLCEILLNGRSAKIGDYVASPEPHVFHVLKKDEFEKLYKFKGPLRT